MKRFAVMGRPIAHSLSPRIHQAFAKQTQVSLLYDKLEPESDDFEKAVEAFFSSGGSGLNITSPFKERAFRMADNSSSLVQAAGAANTLYLKDGLLYAENTDGPGFIKDVEKDFQLEDKRGLILGAGGAARGIIQPLLDKKLQYLTLANRSVERAEALTSLFPQLQLCPLENLAADYDLVIHATAASLNQQSITLPDKLFANRPYCYDLSYQLFDDTPFVQLAKSFECKAIDGLGMLVEQAALAFQFWHGILPETKPVIHSLRERIS